MGYVPGMCGEAIRVSAVSQKELSPMQGVIELVEQLGCDRACHNIVLLASICRELRRFNHHNIRYVVCASITPGHEATRAIQIVHQTMLMCAAE